MLAIKINSGHVIKCPIHGTHIILDRWTCNGTPEVPDFKPSVREYEYNPENPSEKKTRCHYTITAGKIIFHDDNHHAMSNTTVPMIPFTQSEIEHYNSPGYQE